MSSVLTPRPRHPSRPRITTARSSPRVIRRERETETPLGRPVINHLFPFPSVIVFFPIVSSPRRVETPSIDDRTTPNDRRARRRSRSRVTVRARGPIASSIHPSQTSRCPRPVVRLIRPPIVLDGARRDAKTKNENENESTRTSPRARSPVPRVRMRIRIDRPSSRRPFEIDRIRSVHLHLLVYFIIVYDLWTRSIYETRPCGENPNARMRVIHACVHE